VDRNHVVLSSELKRGRPLERGLTLHCPTFLNQQINGKTIFSHTGVARGVHAVQVHLRGGARARIPSKFAHFAGLTSCRCTAVYHFL